MIYTIIESVKPIIIFSGEAFNLFFAGIKKDLYFFQYIVVFVVVIIVWLILILYFGTILLVLIFGYEVNFPFFSFRRNKLINQNPQENPQINNNPQLRTNPPHEIIDNLGHRLEMINLNGNITRSITI